MGDGNKNDAYRTTGTYSVNIHGGEWAGISVSNPSSSWCIGLGQESFRHTGDVTFTIDGGTFAQLVTAGTTRGAGQKSTIVGNVALNLDGELLTAPSLFWEEAKCNWEMERMPIRPG